MIVVIWGALDDSSSCGFLAMRRLESGDWVPVTGSLEMTVAAVAELCVSVMRQESMELRELSASRLERLYDQLARLYDGPTQADRTRIRGQPCAVDQDSRISRPETSEPTRARAQLDLTVDESLYQALCRATGQQNLCRARALRLFIDLVQNQPFELLLAVGNTTPDQVGPLAELMVEIGQRLGVTTGFEPADGAEEPPKDADEAPP